MQRLEAPSLISFIALTLTTEGENTSATLHAVMQIFSNLRAVEDLEPLSFPEAEVILRPGFVVVQSHEQSHPCRKEGKKRTCGAQW